MQGIGEALQKLLSPAGHGEAVEVTAARRKSYFEGVDVGRYQRLARRDLRKASAYYPKNRVPGHWQSLGDLFG
jgi:hypothetical protein